MFGTTAKSRASRFAHGGGYSAMFLAAQMAAYLNRPVPIIILMALIFLAIIMSTQFSFGRAVRGAVQRRRERTRRWSTLRRNGAKSAGAKSSGAR